MIGAAVVMAALFLIVALCAFTAGRQARRLEDLADSRTLHPSTWRATIDQPAGEHVRLVPSVYDWQHDETQGEHVGTDDEQRGGAH